MKVIALLPILFNYWCNILRLPYAVLPVLRDRGLRIAGALAIVLGVMALAWG